MSSSGSNLMTRKSAEVDGTNSMGHIDASFHRNIVVNKSKNDIARIIYVRVDPFDMSIGVVGGRRPRDRSRSLLRGN